MLAFLTSATTALSQGRTADREELHKLLELRKKKFDAYSESLKKRSGFFGGKSKMDIQRSNEVLMDIIESDNKMISVLNRVVDFKTYEKVNMNYELLSCNERVGNLQRAVDALNKQVSTLSSSNAALEKKTGSLKLLASAFGILVLALLILVMRRRLSGAE